MMEDSTIKSLLELLLSVFRDIYSFERRYQIHTKCRALFALMTFLPMITSI